VRAGSSQRCLASCPSRTRKLHSEWDKIELAGLLREAESEGSEQALKLRGKAKYDSPKKE
jgi:hypothetical protein